MLAIFKSEKFQRIAKYVFLALVIVQLLSMSGKFYSTAGWDHDIYCHAASALDKGLDPFITKNTGVHLSYTYPAIFLPLYAGLCSSVGHTYIFIDLLLIAAVVFILIRYLKSDAVLVLPFVCFGFNSVYSNLQTGNVGLWEACALALAMMFCLRGKVWAALFLAPSAFLKIIPGALALPIGFYQSKKWSSRILTWALFGAGGLLLLAANYFYSPELFGSFFNQITGKYADQHSPAHELNSDPSNPTVPLFFKNLAAMISADHWYIFFAIFMIAMVAFSYWLWKKAMKNEIDVLYRMCWAFLILFLWLPRLKPYSLILVVIALLPLLSRLSRKFAFFVILLSIFHRSINGEKHNVWFDYLANNTTIYTLIIVFALTAVRWERLQKKS